MLYFRIHVAPSSAPETGLADAIAHVLVEAEGIQSAATEVVRRLHADQWRIVDVLTARSLHANERFGGNHPLAAARRQAEERGFAVYVEGPIALGDQNTNREEVGALHRNEERQAG